MRDAFIFDHVRTPRGRGEPEGALHEATPATLATQVLAALKERNSIPADGLDDVILGTVGSTGEQGATLHRIAPILAGFADCVPGLQVNRACASGLESITLAASKIGSGMSELIIAGGVESMSRGPLGASNCGPQGCDPAVTFHTPFIAQGVSADLLATLHGYSREDTDAYGAESRKRAAHAWANGYFARSVVPVVDILGTALLDRDEQVQPCPTGEDLAALKPSFKDLGEKAGFDRIAIQRYPQIERIDHVHTSASTSSSADGAGVLLVGSAQAGIKLGARPRARIRSFCTVGSEPQVMLDGPTPACMKALRLAGMEPGDIDLWELNEPFASVALRLMETLRIPHDKINVNGGAIALGHPLGATGAMIAGTLLDEMERRDIGTGMVTLSSAGGMGIALLLERVTDGSV